MPVCSFTLSHAGTPQTLFPVARDAISQSGGSMSGSPASGSIVAPSPVGDVSMRYTASGNRVAIEVTDKPFLASCGAIQSKLAAILARVPAPEPIDVPGEVVASRTYDQPSQSRSGPVEVITDDDRRQYLRFTADEAEVVTGSRRKSSTINWPLFAGISAAAVGGYFLIQKSLPKSSSSRRRTRRRRTTTRPLRI